MDEKTTMDEKTCKICEQVIKACDRLGNREICEKTIQDFKDQKIPIENVMNTIMKNFDQEKFYKILDEIAEENHGTD